MAKSNNKTAKIIFWSFVGVLVLGGLTWGGFQVFGKTDPDAKAKAADDKAKKNPTPDNLAEADKLKRDADLAKGITPDALPLQRGSRDVTDTYVKDVQNWLINKYGRAATLPKYGADGIFGAETEAAVIKYIDDTGMISQSWYYANAMPKKLSFDAEKPPADNFFPGVNLSQEEFNNDIA